MNRAVNAISHCISKQPAPVRRRNKTPFGYGFHDNFVKLPLLTHGNKEE